MAAKNKVSQRPSDKEVVITRVFDAPAERVFDAWLDTRTLGQWLFATPTGQMKKVEIDAHAGGSWLIIEQRGKVKAEHYGKYLKVDRPKCLQFTFGGPGFPDTLVTIDIKPLKTGCALTLTHERVLPEYKERTRQGWDMILDGLASQLNKEDTSDREIVISRVIGAPRKRVWEAMTDPAQVAHWWGPKGFSTNIKRMELKVGGVWEHTMRGPDGTEYPNKSIFREIVNYEKIVYSLGGGRRDGRGASFIATWTFEDEGKTKTRLTGRLVFPTGEDRDFVVKEYGAIEGGKQTLERLDEYLAQK